MKSLEVIQKIVKVLRILAKIAYIFCIIGAVASAIGAASLFAIDENSEIWKKALEAIQPDTIDLAAVRCTCLTGVFVCAAGAVLSWFSKRLFEDELAAGTPFDRHICKDVLKVGIIYLAVSVGSRIIMAIIYACFNLDADGSGFPGFSTGIVYIICWLLCRYGADVKEGVGVDANGNNGDNGTDGINDINGVNGVNGGAETTGKVATSEESGNNGDDLF